MRSHVWRKNRNAIRSALAWVALGMACGLIVNELLPTGASFQSQLGSLIAGALVGGTCGLIGMGIETTLKSRGNAPSKILRVVSYSLGYCAVGAAVGAGLKLIYLYELSDRVDLPLWGGVTGACLGALAGAILIAQQRGPV